VRDVAGFIAWARQADGKLTLASQGNGSIGHLAGALFAQDAGLAFTHVPYRGGGPAVIDLVAGHIQALFVTLPAAIEHIRAGRLRALAVTSAKRVPALPEVPTIAESGFPGFDISEWVGLFAPAGTPAPMIARLHEVLAASLAEPEVRARLAQLGAVPVGSAPEAFTRFVTEGRAAMTVLVREANIRVE